jgi:hypothetical protein
MSISFLRPTTALAVVALLTLGACSGGDGGSPASDRAADSASPAPDSAAVDAATDAASAAEADAAAAAAEGGEAAVDTSFCAEVESAWSAANTAQVSMSVDHPRTLVTGFENARTALKGVEPPADLAADWKVVTGYLSTAADAVAKADIDSPKAIVEALDDAGKDLDTEAMTAASARITQYLDTTCGG